LDGVGHIQIDQHQVGGGTAQPGYRLRLTDTADQLPAKTCGDGGHRVGAKVVVCDNGEVQQLIHDRQSYLVAIQVDPVAVGQIELVHDFGIGYRFVALRAQRQVQYTAH